MGAVTPELVVVERPLPTNYITGYFAAPTLTDPDYVAFRAATDILGDRLFEEVRTKRNMTSQRFRRWARTKERSASRGVSWL